MPIKKSAVKKVRQDKKRRLFNKSRKDAFKVKIKEVKKYIGEKKPEKAKEAATQAISALDKAAKTQTIHKNTAARKKSRLLKFLNKSLGKAVDLKARKKEAPRASSEPKTEKKSSSKKAKTKGQKKK